MFETMLVFYNQCLFPYNCFNITAIKHTILITDSVMMPILNIIGWICRYRCTA